MSLGADANSKVRLGPEWLKLGILSDHVITEKQLRINVSTAKLQVAGCSAVKPPTFEQRGKFHNLKRKYSI